MPGTDGEDGSGKQLAITLFQTVLKDVQVFPKCSCAMEKSARFSTLLKVVFFCLGKKYLQLLTSDDLFCDN